MSSWQSLHYLNLLWLLFPLIALFVFAHWRRKSMLLRFANPCQTERLAKSASAPARFFRATLFLLACAAIILALARPSWNKSHQPFKAKGRDVVFILDISRSMLAAHRNTTRLEEAKFAIQECLSTVRGDRVALIIFAGNAKVACPLTHDYAYFLAKLNDVDYRSVTFGGTMLGDAIRLACSSIFKTRAQLYRDVIVITDGEDMESNPVQAAEQLAELNARLIIVGMGDSTPSPLRITTPDGGTETIMDNGKPVMTRLDIDTLQKMTEATTGGILIPVPSDTMLNLNDIYSKYIEQQVKKDFETHSVITYEEKYQLFLVMAMVLLTIMILIPERRRLAVTAGIALLFAALPVSAENAMPREAVHLINQAKRQMEANDLEAAKESLAKSLELQADNPLAIYNRAAIDYLQGNYQEAQNGFQQALTLAQAQELDYPDFQEKVNLAIASCAFRLSQKEDNQNPQPDAERAVKYFKNALDCNPQNLTTKDNLNTAKLNYKAIRQKLKQQQQQQSANGNDGKQQDNKEDDSQNEGNNAQNAQKQNQESNENKEGDNQKNEQQKALEDLEQQQRQAASDLKDDAKSNQELKQQQENLQQQAKDALDKQEQNASQHPEQQNKKAEDFMKQSLAKQQEAKEQLDQNNKEKAQEAQKDAADLTQMARQALNEQQNTPQPEQQDAKQQQAQQQPDATQQPEDKEQPKQSDARAIDAINQENINRLNRQRKAFNAPAAHNKDW